MSTTYLGRQPVRATPKQVLAWLGEPMLRRIALSAIVILAAVLRFANLGSLGYVNHYYSAGITSMIQSWHNFFFLAAEPGGAVSIDKPPVGLWLQAISAYIFGVNGFGVLLPEILAGIASVVVVYHLVRRSFGTAAGLLSALALAITPVVIAVDRNNTIDSTLILTLLLSAWAFIKATETHKLRFLLLGTVLVGIGFNIKMLAAFLPLPAFYALYFLGASERIWRKIGKLALATVVLVAVSLSWATIVDLIPASQRPYVGSSGDNSVINLMIGYNGLNRLNGMGGGNNSSLVSRLFGGSSQTGRNGGTAPQGGRNNRLSQGQAQPGTNGTTTAPQQPATGANNGFQGRGQGGGQGGGGQGGGGMGNGFNTGQTGMLRLFSAPLSNEVSWLLPFGLFSMVLLLLRSRVRWPIEPKHQAVVLWGGWLLTGMAFFTVAGFFHPYYLAILAAPLAVLVGIGAAELWRIREERPWLASGLLLLAAGVTLAFQLYTAHAFVGSVWWLAISIALFVVGVTLLLVSARRRMQRVAIAGFVTVMAALLITPGIWSGYTNKYFNSNQSLPAAYAGTTSGTASGGGLQIDQELLAYLEANTSTAKYLLAVPSSMQGSDYVLATGRPVLYLGGFMGQDEVANGTALAKLVTNGELRYIYWDAQNGGGFGGGGGSQSDISAWVTNACKAVPGFETTTQNSGAPGGTTRTTDATQTQHGGMQVTLYDCGA